MNHLIANFETLGINPARKDALSIIEAGYNAIDTTLAVKNTILLEGDILSIKGNKFNIEKYKRIFLIGFGKASCKAVQAIEDVLGNKLNGGVVIDKDLTTTCCKVVQVYKGTHPLPSKENVEASQKIVDLAKDATENDFVIVVVSGGGSALLCFPMSEWEQGNNLYKTFLHTGGTIKELNTLRKHTSEIKGGGLAKMLYPATVVSLILCDIPGNNYEDTASGPTYFDNTSVKDAEKLIEKYSLANIFTFNETPKDSVYFEKVTNIPFISNKEALQAMSDVATKLGYEVTSLGEEMYDTPNVMLEKMKKALKPHSIVLAGGELALTLKKEGGIGGRNFFTCGQAIESIDDKDVFVAFASDGVDNLSISAGAIVDIETKNKIKEKNILLSDFMDKDKYDELFTLLGDNIITGPTGSNVSDLYLMLRQ